MALNAHIAITHVDRFADYLVNVGSHSCCCAKQRKDPCLEFILVTFFRQRFVHAYWNHPHLVCLHLLLITPIQCILPLLTKTFPLAIAATDILLYFCHSDSDLHNPGFGFGERFPNCVSPILQADRILQTRSPAISVAHLSDSNVHLQNTQKPAWLTLQHQDVLVPTVLLPINSANIPSCDLTTSQQLLYVSLLGNHIFLWSPESPRGIFHTDCCVTCHHCLSVFTHQTPRESIR